MMGEITLVQNVTVLGATGSIGRSTLDVIGRHPELYRVFALTANRQVELLYQQCLEYKPQYAVMADENSAAELAQLIAASALKTDVLAGLAGLQEVSGADEADVVMAAIVGAAGLLPTLSAIESGKRVLLANKESLVMSGALFMDAVKRSGTCLLPIDSEHNAIYQCLPANYMEGMARVGIRRILLTASGGPFRTTPIDQLTKVTPDQACAHPNWPMGRKISVDSATMMNKGLEAIEACWLFGLTPDQVEVVIHPQSIVHSMVDYVDGSVLAQLGNPDMRTPIAYGLAWPERIDSGVSPLDLVKLGRLDFATPDYGRFPCLKLAMDAVSAGGTAMAILNGVNEVAVSAFLAGQIGFLDIARLNEAVLNDVDSRPASDLDLVLAADADARHSANKLLASGLFSKGSV